MDPQVARSIAHYSHVDQRDRFGEPIIEHIERVATTVPDEARTVAYLHDVLEWSNTTADDLIAQGLTPLELAAIDILTRAEGESYESHALRVAAARGPAGRIARSVKLADLDDHLGHASLPHGAPPYAWARRRIAVAGERAAGSGAAA